MSYLGTPSNFITQFFPFFSDSCSQQIAKEHRSDQPIKCSKTSYGIVKTNSFSIELSDLRSYLAIFPIISRLNHSCQPNCNHYWSGSQFKGKIQNLFFFGLFVCLFFATIRNYIFTSVRAIQKINEDEELTISYMSPLQRCDFHTRESRRKILFEEFGFWCNCNLCDAINLGT